MDLMTTTRYFEVKVTGCNDCRYLYESDFQITGMSAWCGMYPRNQEHPMSLITDNFDQLTTSCPMYNETKEN